MSKSERIKKNGNTQRKTKFYWVKQKPVSLTTSRFITCIKFSVKSPARMCYSKTIVITVKAVVNDFNVFYVTIIVVIHISTARRVVANHCSRKMISVRLLTYCSMWMLDIFGMRFIFEMFTIQNEMCLARWKQRLCF